MKGLCQRFGSRKAIVAATIALAGLAGSLSAVPAGAAAPTSGTYYVRVLYTNDCLAHDGYNSQVYVTECGPANTHWSFRQLTYSTFVLQGPHYRCLAGGYGERPSMAACNQYQEAQHWFIVGHGNQNWAPLSASGKYLNTDYEGGVFMTYGTYVEITLWQWIPVYP